MLGCDTAYEVNRWNHVGGTVGKVPGKDLLEEMRIWAIGGDSGYQVQKIKTNSETVHFRLGLESMCRNLNPTKTLYGIPIRGLLIRITHLVSRPPEAQVPCVSVYWNIYWIYTEYTEAYSFLVGRNSARGKMIGKKLLLLFSCYLVSDFTPALRQS